MRKYRRSMETQLRFPHGSFSVGSHAFRTVFKTPICCIMGPSMTLPSSLTYLYWI